MTPSTTTPSTTTSAVLFIGFGGPDKPEDIMPFLEIVTRGRGIPRERLLDVAHHYEVIGGKSPINEITLEQANLLEQELRAQGSGLKVYVGQRNWHPFLEDTLRKMAADGITRAIGVPSAGHRCEASLERYIRAVEMAREKVGPQAPVIEFVGPWFDHPLFIDTMVERVKECLVREYGSKGVKSDSHTPIPPNASDFSWHFTAHSIPCGMAKESTYVQELRRTAQLIADRFGKKEWGIAYSSRSGNPREPWLEPDVCDVVRAEAAKGRKNVLFIPIGFIADHVEILFDLDIEAQDAAKEAGITLLRARSAGTHPLFAKMLAEMVIRRTQEGEAPEQRDSHKTKYRDGATEACVGVLSPTCYCQPDSKDPPCVKWKKSLLSAPASRA